MATVHADGSPSLVISCTADYLAGEITLQPDEAVEWAWVSLEEAKGYDLIDGIYDELAIAEIKTLGQKITWHRQSEKTGFGFNRPDPLGK